MNQLINLIFTILALCTLCQAKVGDLKTCSDDIKDINKDFQANKIAEGYWIAAYSAKFTNRLSIFHQSNFGHFDYNFRIMNDTAFQITVTCVKEKDFIKPFKSIITKIGPTSIQSVNIINEEYCGRYVSAKYEHSEVRVIDTDYSTYLILYSCYNGEEGIAVFVKNYNLINNIYSLKIKNLNFLNSKRAILTKTYYTIDGTYSFCVTIENVRYSEKNCDAIADKKFFTDTSKLDTDLEESVKRSIFRPFRYKLDGMFNYLSDDKGPKISIFLTIVLVPIFIKLMEYFFESI